MLDAKALLAAMAGCDFAFHFQANADVRGGKFPEEQHCYHMLAGEHERFLAYTGEDG